jgi:nanoRNase/pAp phosphatase (c-di-AMP/oligoRNAs hydrolase)
MIEMDYSKPVLVEEIEEGEKIFIVDFSFKPEVMNEVLKRTEDVVWIDHHKTALEYENQYNKYLAGVRNKDFAACELCWEFFFGSKNASCPAAIMLIGDMDTWKFKYGDETTSFIEGMRLYPHQPADLIWDDLLEGGGWYAAVQKDVIEKIQAEGEICVKYRDSFCADYLKSFGFETEIEGHSCCVLNLAHMGSLALGPIYAKYDMGCTFAFDGKGYSISLYSDKVDVSEIAKKYGGGGHRGAAGCNVPELPFKRTGDLHLE